jgi:hypothetical protein
LVSEGGNDRTTVEVAISGTAMSSSNVPLLVEEARRTRGQSVVAGVVGWDRPPERIELDSESVKPKYEGGDPGAEVRELNAITDWFDDQGLLVVFTAGGYGHSPSTINWKHNVSIFDGSASGRLLLRVEGKPSRFAALREAKVQWEARSGEHKTLHLSDDLTVTDEASTEVTPADAAKKRLQELGVHLVFSRTSEADDAFWVGEVYDEDGINLKAVQVAETLDDLWLVLADDVLPDENR